MSMELRDIHPTGNAGLTLTTMREHGLLLSSVDADGRPNTMTIGWGNIGVIWAQPIFIAYVRPSRFTFGNIEATREFVVSVPTDEMHEICMYCGSKSGRDVNKFAERNLTAVKASRDCGTVPLIAECVRHYECKVVHYNDVIDAAIDPVLRADNYPNGNFHRIYYGKILRATERD
jgi:flavin reductase (DIM6/NTAB) family NADH-FMN oxidoreductase RutF